MPSTLNTSLIAKSFAKSINTYHQHAVIQKQMAEKLTALLSKELSHRTQYRILELGCGTGFLTQQFCKQLAIESLIVNDINPDFKSIVSSHTQAYNIRLQFIEGNASTIQPDHQLDIIAANALLQWIDDKTAFFKHLQSFSHNSTVLAFSCFSADHFKEIKQIVGIGLAYPDKKMIEEQALPHFKLQTYHEDHHTLYFESPLAVLKHIKKTGVNAIQKTHWRKKDLQQFISHYNQFKTDKGYPLSYHPNYFILKKT